jgi:hypothetical protein
VRFPNKETECSSQHMPGSLPGQPQEMTYSQSDNLTKVSYKEADQLNMELTKKPNSPNKANIGSTRLLTATQLY